VLDEVVAVVLELVGIDVDDPPSLPASGEL